MPSVSRIKEIIKTSIQSLWVSLKYNFRKRYVPGYVSFDSKRFYVTDIPSVGAQIQEIYIHRFLEIPTQIGNGGIIIDCGANVGISTVYYAEQHPNAKVISYEADPAIFKYLEKNIESTGYKNIELIQKAVWINNESIEFAQEGSASGSIYGQSNKVKVPCVRFKDVLQSHEHIDILKIDIEGAEVEVIQDCKDELYRADYIFLEYHSFSNQKQVLPELLSILKSNQFKYFIQEAYVPKKPRFLWMAEIHDMDLQLNIYAIKESLIQ